MPEPQPHPPAAVRLLERAGRLVPEPPPGSAVTDLAAGLPVAEVAERRGLPEATVRGIATFYAQLDRRASACEGTACRFAGGAALREKLESVGPVAAVRCLGHCYAAPAFRSGDKVFTCPPSESLANWLDEWGEGPSPMPDLKPAPCSSLAAEPVVLRDVLPGAARDPFAAYDLPAGDAILDAVAAAGMRGRGGAVVATADKWRLARATPAARRWVVANGDEGDPGSYVGRLLLEEAPHAVLAGMLACARATGATRGIVHVRVEYPRAARRMREAIAAAAARGAFGGTFGVEVVVGAGAYVCGEESALLRSLEGLRGEPAPEPPYAAERGLFGEPTVVHSIETFAAVPWTVANRRASGTKAVCLSGAVKRPGVVEVPLGMPLAEVLERGGGGAPDGRAWSMALVGGPTGRVLPASRFATPLSWDALPGMGHAGVVVLDDTVTPRALAEHLFAFAAAESCGACTPCRAGTARLAAMRDRAALERLLGTIAAGSLCGFGRGVPSPIRDLLEHFGEETLR